MTTMTQEYLIEQLTKEGYTNIREISGIGLCGIYRFIFTIGLCIRLEEHGYKGRYCYNTRKQATDALDKWDGRGNPSEDWIKYKGEGGERSNPSIPSI